MGRKPNTKCEICGKPLYRRPFELKKNPHVCCKGCRSALYKKFKNYNVEGLKKGHGWNKGLSKVNGDKLDYGRPRSEEIKQHISEGLKKVLIKKGVNRTCPICKKIFYVYPSVLKLGRGLFCSRRCATIANNLVQKTHDTDIERIMEKWLIENNVEYQKQKHIEGLSIPDFFIEPNVCVYADGVYWHSLEDVIKRDKRINENLEKKGYEVIRITGTNIKKGIYPNELEKTINKVVQPP